LDSENSDDLVVKIVTRSRAVKQFAGLPSTVQLFKADDAREVLELVKFCLEPDFKERPTIQEIMNHKYFDDLKQPGDGGICVLQSPTSPSSLLNAFLNNQNSNVPENPQKTQ
jgi:hypothetical protein